MYGPNTPPSQVHTDESPPSDTLIYGDIQTHSKKLFILGVYRDLKTMLPVSSGPLWQDPGKLRPIHAHERRRIYQDPLEAI